MDWEEKRKEEAKKVVRALSDFVNSYSKNTELIEAMSREHRTLQQKMTVVCLEWLIHLSELDGAWYDLRNKASVEIAKKIVEAVPEIKYGLPLI